MGESYRMFFIAAPFGNYINFRQQFLGKKFISVSGTWTREPRPGRFIQTLKTLRYTKHGWVNRLGLRNKGIKYGLKQNYQVLSLASIDPNDWEWLNKLVPSYANVEINLSCPNIKHNLWPGFNSFTKTPREWCIAKIPPTYKEKEIDFLIESGFKQIHACNTIPTPKGGLSGRDIVPHTIRILKYIKRTHPHIEVIAGGGIYSKEDVNRYRDYGADHFSLGTICFTPWKIKSVT